MNRRASVFLLTAALAMVLDGAMAGSQQQPAPRKQSAREVASLRLAEATRLYDEGQYEGCRDLVALALGEAGQPAGLAAAGMKGPLSGLYALEALLAYTFRDSGYEEAVDASLSRALEWDPYLDIGEPGRVPAYVLGRFQKLRDAYLARFARSARRNALGISTSLVLDILNPALLQPGLSYTRNISDSFSIDAQLRIPLRWPPWNSLRGQLGILFFPAFSIERVTTGVSASYLFGLDELSVFTHAISLGTRMELLSRSGFGFAANAELLRVDLVLGATTLPEIPSYTPIPLLGLVRVVFANITLHAFYAF